MAKVRFQDSSGGEVDGNAPALDMDYLEATGKYLQVEYLIESRTQSLVVYWIHFPVDSVK